MINDVNIMVSEELVLMLEYISSEFKRFVQ